METCRQIKQIKEYMRMYHMAETGDGILAAVSGGADSVCLLLVLDELSEELGVHLSAFHMNHGLRGEEADRDEAYVRKLCEDMGISLRVVREDVREYAKEHGLSEEEAGRVLRYHHMECIAQELNCAKIAVAHHRDDHEETVLMNLFRGTGLRGLGGIRPVRGKIIRPLLCMTREEIEFYLYKKKVVWCEDSTNGENEYGRNRVRNLLIPWVREQVNERAGDHILKIAEVANQADEYFTEQAEKILTACGTIFETQNDRRGVRIPSDRFDEQPPIMKSYLVRAMICQVVKTEKDISARHIDAVCALTGPGGGTKVSLPYDLEALRGYEYVEIRQNAKNKSGTCLYAEEESICWQVVPGQGITLGKSGFFVETRVFSWEKGMEIPKNQYTKWFDYDRIENTLLMRRRKTGDYLTIKDGQRKLLKRFFIDEKIPAAIRGEMLLLADGDHILWIPEFRISEEYKVTDMTRMVLEVRLYKGDNDG